MDNLDFQETETTLAVQQIECTVHKLLTKAGKLSRISVFSSFHKTQYISKFCKQKQIHDKVYVFFVCFKFGSPFVGHAYNLLFWE